jgi:hypothetical protein
LENVTSSARWKRPSDERRAPKVADGRIGSRKAGTIAIFPNSASSSLHSVRFALPDATSRTVPGHPSLGETFDRGRFLLMGLE